MKKLKNIALTLAALGIMSSAAAEEGIMPISAQPDSITVNGTVLSGAKTVTFNGTTMIPLRAICENLGFEVDWSDEARRIELRNLPIYITLTPGTDGYTFAKTAAMKLGVAPIIAENRTYVPINFIDEILGGEYTQDNGLSITWGESSDDKTESDAVSVYIKEKTDEGFLVEDFYRGEVRLVVSDKTVIKDADGKTITADDIDESNELLVKYSDAMAMSLPPMVNALEITKTNDIAKTVLEGKITEITTEEKSGKLTQITLEIDGKQNAVAISEETTEKTEEETSKTVVLNISDDTVITDAEGKPVAIDATTAIGKNVRARTTGISTRSIPPQSPTTAIIVF